MTRIQLLLVDDHILFRESLRRLLDSEEDFDVVSDCATTGEACAVVQQCPVDVTLLDFDLTTTDAGACMQALFRAGYDGRILIVTGSITQDQSAAVLRMGAAGIFFKHNSPGMLRQAIRAVAAGVTWIDPPAMQLMSEPAEERRHHVDRSQWTEREEQVLQGVFEGLANKEIGARLGVSESAVKSTLQQLFHKTGVRTRSQLVRIALEVSSRHAPLGSAAGALQAVAER